MSDTAVLGKYWPAESPIHHMDPRAKMLLSLGAMAVIFCAQSFIGLALCAVFTFAFITLSHIPVTQMLKSIVPLLFIVVLTALINIFFTQGGTVYVSWGCIQISEAGLYRAAFMGCRLLLLLLCMSLLTLTTTTIDITDAFERLLTPFARIGLPAHELSMIMGIALRFLPQFIEESKTLYRAQTSRGAAFTSGSIKRRFLMLGSLMIPLFTSAFRHAETLSSAMDARCYHGGPGRTRLHPLHYSYRDGLALCVLLAFLVTVLASNMLALGRII